MRNQWKWWELIQANEGVLACRLYWHCNNPTLLVLKWCFSISTFRDLVVLSALDDECFAISLLHLFYLLPSFPQRQCLVFQDKVFPSLAIYLTYRSCVPVKLTCYIYVSHSFGRECIDAFCLSSLLVCLANREPSPYYYPFAGFISLWIACTCRHTYMCDFRLVMSSVSCQRS